MKLRPFSIEDAPVILSWIKDKTDFRKWSADRYSSYPPKPEDMLAQYANDIIFPFTAIDDAGKVIGHIILRYPDSSKTVIRLGFIIIDNQLRGKGYGKQMLELAIQKAQRDYKVQKSRWVFSTIIHQPYDATNPLDLQLLVQTPI